FVQSTHGKTHLCYEGYRYYCHHTNADDSKYWKCVKKYCRVGITTYANGTTKRSADHDHTPNETDKEVLNVRQNLKRKVVESSSPIDSIVDETYANLQSPTKERRKTREPLPKNINDLPYPIPPNYQKSQSGEQFILYDGPIAGSRCIIFSTPSDILYLSQSEM
ncbi:unnamed protein product, partial [Didymodactylos carnosus]